MNYPKLFSPEEITELSKTIQKGCTPIWKYWDEFVECYLELGKSEVTVRRVRDTLRFLTREFGFYELEDFESARELRKKLMALMAKRGWSGVTYNTYIKNMNTYFIWLEREDLITKNNIRSILKCKEQVKQQHTLTKAEVDSMTTLILDRIQPRLLRLRNLLIIQLLTRLGVRNCELLEIRCSDITRDREGYKIVIRGRKQKGGPRYYKLRGGLKDAYLAYVEFREKIGRGDEKLLISLKKGKALTNSGLRKFFDRMSSDLGFRVNVYPIRRYVATSLNTKGLALQKIADYLGHTRVSTTLRYIERSCVRTNDCLDVMMGE